MSIYGLTGTPLASPTVLWGLKWAGVGYMLWLALEAILPQRPAGPAVPIIPFAGGRQVLRGIIANVLIAERRERREGAEESYGCRQTQAVVYQGVRGEQRRQEPEGQRADHVDRQRTERELRRSPLDPG